jgi:hypothetical protein
MTDGGVGPPIPAGTDDGWVFLVRPYPSVERKKNDFWKTMEGRGGPKWSHLPTKKTEEQYMDTWSLKTPSGVNLDFQRRAMNCERSRNFPTGKCDVISGKSVGCGRPELRKDFSSPGVMNPGTREPESVLPAQRNVLNERGRVQSEGTQFFRRSPRMNHRLYYKRKNVCCILIQHLNESIELSYLTTLNTSHLQPLQMLQRPSGIS